MRHVWFGLGLLLAAMPMSSGAFAQGVSDETYLDLGRCEGFYVGLEAYETDAQSKEAARSSLAAVRTAKQANLQPELDTAYREAVSAGRRAFELNATAGEERLKAYVARRSAHCEAVVGGLASF